MALGSMSAKMLLTRGDPSNSQKEGPGALLSWLEQQTRPIDEIRLRQRALDSRSRSRDQIRLDQSAASLGDGNKQVVPMEQQAMALLLLQSKIATWAYLQRIKPLPPAQE